jgi:diaminohydroxyphosphoribosylaminopyrimidine deaminase/5-amino-6-(5-phosphoribosylamino)uracil reductase
MAETAKMAQCIRLAQQAEGRTAPNPMVGAIIEMNGVVLAEGWHRASGQDHAEVDGLNQLGGRAEGATVYVNLEPCCHIGRTPPCTDALIAAGVSRVVVGMIDPDPRVHGKGIDKLRAAGIEVILGASEDACRQLNSAYLMVHERGRPWITVKAAITLDGRIADAEGASQWITGDAARAAGHDLRNTHDAVLIGAGTLRADNPSLNTRNDGGRDAIPILLDTNLSCPGNARVLSAGHRPIIYCAEDADPRDLPADVVRMPRDPSGRIPLTEMAQDLATRGVHSVLVEGGGAVIRGLLDAGLVDRIELFVAPKVFAGGAGWVGGEPYPLSAAPGFVVVHTATLDPDVHITLEREPCSAESSPTLAQ